MFSNSSIFCLFVCFVSFALSPVFSFRGDSTQLLGIKLNVTFQMSFYFMVLFFKSKLMLVSDASFISFLKKLEVSNPCCFFSYFNCVIHEA
jgi:hypothetical protein